MTILVGPVARSTDSPFPERSAAVLPHILDRQSRSSPGACCAVFEDGSVWTYADAHEVATRGARALADAGVRRGDRVAVLLPNGPAFLRAWWGIAAAGAVTAPLHTALHGPLLAQAVEDIGPRMFVTDSSFDAALDAASDGTPIGVPRLRPADLERGAAAPVELDPPLDVWDLHTVNFTSGTTGRAKGVLASWLQAFMGGWYVFGGGVGLTADERWLVDLPLHHVAAQQMTIAAMSAGASVAVRTRFRGTDYWRTAKQAGATRSLLAGTMGAFLLARPAGPGDRDHSLRTVVASPMVPDPETFAARFGLAGMATAFGGTETGSPLIAPAGSPLPSGSCGRPRPGVQVRIVDEHDGVLPIGECGELVLRTDTPWELTVGYLGRADATVSAWRNGWFHTGDVFRRDTEGWYYFVDRLTDSIRRRGENISSTEVEAQAARHPDVADVACVGAITELGDHDVRLFVVPRPAATVEPAALLAFLTDRLPHFMLPRFVDLVDALPRTTTMKIRKADLRDTPVGPDTWDRERAGTRTGPAR